MKNTIIILIVVVLVIIGGYFLLQRYSGNVYTPADQGEATDTPQDTEQTPVDTTQEEEGTTLLGTSVEGRNITAYHYGTGDTELLFVGGIHGGYEWNTALVAYELMDHLSENPDAIPANVKVTVVPVLNPDGLYKTVGTAARFSEADVPTDQSQTIPGRFNAHNVDLNRNFDCDWQTTGTWQNKSVDGGTAAFSEPESQAIRDYIQARNPAAVVVWYSSAGGVFAANCHNGILPETRTLTNLYADASGYPAYEEFNFYEITGDMVNWLAKENIPAISVLLTTHQDIEWSKNWAGIEALFAHYAE